MFGRRDVHFHVLLYKKKLVLVVNILANGKFHVQKFLLLIKLCYIIIIEKKLTYMLVTIKNILMAKISYLQYLDMHVYRRLWLLSAYYNVFVKHIHASSFYPLVIRSCYSWSPDAHVQVVTTYMYHTLLYRALQLLAWLLDT